MIPRIISSSNFDIFRENILGCCSINSKIYILCFSKFLNAVSALSSKLNNYSQSFSSFNFSWYPSKYPVKNKFRFYFINSSFDRIYCSIHSNCLPISRGNSLTISYLIWVIIQKSTLKLKKHFHKIILFYKYCNFFMTFFINKMRVSKFFNLL